MEIRCGQTGFCDGNHVFCDVGFTSNFFKGDGSFSPEAKWRADSGRLLQNGRVKV